MARLARVVVPDYPHHVTQRGNGRARTEAKDIAKAYFNGFDVRNLGTWDHQ